MRGDGSPQGQRASRRRLNCDAPRTGNTRHLGACAPGRLLRPAAAATRRRRTFPLPGRNSSCWQPPPPRPPRPHGSSLRALLRPGARGTRPSWVAASRAGLRPPCPGAHSAAVRCCQENSAAGVGRVAFVRRRLADTWAAASNAAGSCADTCQASRAQAAGWHGDPQPTPRGQPAASQAMPIRPSPRGGRCVWRGLRLAARPTPPPQGPRAARRKTEGSRTASATLCCGLCPRSTCHTHKRLPGLVCHTQHPRQPPSRNPTSETHTRTVSRSPGRPPPPPRLCPLQLRSGQEGVVWPGRWACRGTKASGPSPGASPRPRPRTPHGASSL